MHIVITGATGVIGWRAARDLLAEGHRVTGVVRSAGGRDVLARVGARAVEADVFDPDQLRRAFAGADAVVNLLTRIPAAREMGRPEAWRENDRLRREASAVVASAAQDAGAVRLVQESLGFLYADGGDDWLDEDAPLAPAGTAATALDAERHARERFDGDTVVLRFGLFIGPDSGLTLADLQAARAGTSLGVGRRERFVPTVWLDDAATAVVAALRVRPGTYNVADEDPPRRADLDRALAAAVGRRDLVADTADRDPVSRSLRLCSRRLGRLGQWRPRVRAGIDGWQLIERARLAA